MCAPFRFLLKQEQYLAFALIQSEQRNKRYNFTDDDLSGNAEYPNISADYSTERYFFRVLFVVNQELKMICYSKKSNYVKSIANSKGAENLTEQTIVCSFE